MMRVFDIMDLFKGNDICIVVMVFAIARAQR